MNQQEFTRDLLSFISASPTGFHAVDNFRPILNRNGFSELLFPDDWHGLDPGRYYVCRNDSSIIAFTLNGDDPGAAPIRLAGAHTDSPALKLKPKPDRIKHSLLQLGVETYGGALLNTWFDRDLSIAGRVTWRNPDTGIRSSLVDFRRPVAFIPSLAIHLNRKANDQKPLNKQTDLVPVTMQVPDGEEPDFISILRQQLIHEHPDIAEPDILDHELFLYDTQPASFLGFNNDFITGARLDNLLSCYTLIQALVNTPGDQNCLVVLNDHEEVGSLSACGAQGPFLQTVLERLWPDRDSRMRSIAESLFISTDNAHAVHPNFVDRHDQDHLPLINGGPVIKYNANQRYATTSRTAAFYRELSNRAGVPVQEFVMRSDLACGSTIGPLTAGEIGIQTIDIGAPTLGMHSIREIAGSLDAWSLCEVMKIYFTLVSGDGIWQCIS